MWVPDAAVCAPQVVQLSEQLDQSELDERGGLASHGAEAGPSAPHQLKHSAAASMYTPEVLLLQAVLVQGAGRYAQLLISLFLPPLAWPSLSPPLGCLCCCHGHCCLARAVVGLSRVIANPTTAQRLDLRQALPNTMSLKTWAPR